MKLGFNGATTMISDLPTDIQVASKAGFSFLEIWGSKLDEYLKKHSPNDVRILLEKANIKAATINSVEDATLQDDTGFGAIKQRCREWAQQGREFGAKTLIIIPSPNRDNLNWDEVKARSVESLHALAEICSPYGVRLAFEFLAFDWCSVSRLDRCHEIIETVNRDNVGLVLDTFHYYGGGSKPDMIRQCDPDKIFMVHIDDAEDKPRSELQDKHRLFPGTGILPLNDIFRTLDSIGYDGPVSVELFRPEYWDWDPQKTADKSFEAVSQVLNQAGVQISDYL